MKQEKENEITNERKYLCNKIQSSGTTAMSTNINAHIRNYRPGEKYSIKYFHISC